MRAAKRAAKTTPAEDAQRAGDGLKTCRDCGADMGWDELYLCNRCEWADELAAAVADGDITAGEACARMQRAGVRCST